MKGRLRGDRVWAVICGESAEIMYEDRLTGKCCVNRIAPRAVSSSLHDEGAAL